MSSGAYLAAEDSALLRDALRAYSGESCLEIGAGNGGNIVELARGFRLVAATDLVRSESVDWRSAGASYLLSDSAVCFRDESFDLVAFNPPYVPSEGRVDLTVDGGRDGVEVALRFLKEALRVVKDDGRVVMVSSSDNPVDELERECGRRGFEMKKVSERRLFYETLYVYEASAPDRGTQGDR